jgi:hypothetical protein
MQSEYLVDDHDFVSSSHTLDGWLSHVFRVAAIEPIWNNHIVVTKDKDLHLEEVSQ